NISLVPGTHNVVAASVPMGTLQLKIEGSTANFSSVPCIVRRAGEDEILFVQDANTTQRYLTGLYDLEILTLPRIIMKGIQIEEAKVNTIKIPKAGTLLATPAEAGVASIFIQQEKGLEKIYDFYSIRNQESVNLQPGNYLIVYRPDKGKQAERTKQISI